jgi:small GTP-binding protein
MALADTNVVFVGDVNVGKTALIYHYTANSRPVSPICSRNFQLSPCFAERTRVEVNICSRNVPLSLCDTSGHPNWKSVIPQYFRKAEVIVVVFDFSCRKSFDNVPNWVHKVTETTSDCKFILVANKIDLPDPVVSKDEAETGFSEIEFCERCFTSAVTGSGVPGLFECIGEVALKIRELEGHAVQMTERPRPRPASSPPCDC